MAEGYIYTLDESKFEKYGVIAYEREIGECSYDNEVTIRAGNYRSIPKKVIVNKHIVRPT